MKGRLLSFCCVMTMFTGIAALSAADRQAASDESMIDGSYLAHDDEPVDYDTKITRGDGLLVGYLKCAEDEPERLYGGGRMVAVYTVNEVGASVSAESAQKKVMTIGPDRIQSGC